MGLESVRLFVDSDKMAQYFPHSQPLFIIYLINFGWTVAVAAMSPSVTCPGHMSRRRSAATFGSPRGCASS